MPKQVSKSVQEYVWKADRLEPKESQTVIYFMPMSKGDKDKYINSLTEFKKNKFVSYADKAFSILLEKTLKPKDGVYVKNATWTDTKPSNITDLSAAVDWCMGLTPADGDELELVLRGASTLDEDEEKN